MGRKIRVGVIGCGQIAQIEHLPYLQESLDFELYALCDLSREVVETLGEIYGICPGRRYTDMDEMLKDEKLEAVVICTKDHYEPGVKAARAGKHMLIEKPLAYNLEQADEMIREAKKNQVILMVGYMKRYDPGYEYFKEAVQNLEGISLVRVHDFGGSFDFTNSIFNIHRGNDIPQETIEKGQKEIQQAIAKQMGKEREHLGEAYSLMLGLSTHDTILMRHAFGEPKVLFADVYQDTFITSVLDYGTFRCVFESGLVMDRRSWDEKLWVYAPKKNVSLHFPWPYLKNHPTVVKINENEGNTMVNAEKTVVNNYEESYRNEWKHFYDCIVNKKEPLTSGEDARKDIQLAYDMMLKVEI